MNQTKYLAVSQAAAVALAHEESFIESCRRRVEEQYEGHGTGCGSSFGELLCFELHHGGPNGTGLTFGWLASKWGISLSVLGELLADHCRRLEPMVQVNHEYVPP